MPRPDKALVVEEAARRSPRPVSADRTSGTSFRFTSNIVGPIFFFADVLCLIVSAPMAVIAYTLLFHEQLIPSVHLFAFTMVAASFLLIRSSQRAYRRTLMDLLHEEGDAIFDAVISSLLASALVWQFGLIENYSRGVSLLFLVSFITSLALSRPLIRAHLRRLAARGAIEQRIAFYGADPQSIAFIKQVLTSLDLPHLRFVGVADDRPNVSALEGMKLIGGYAELAELARQGEIDQVLISVPNLSRDRLREIVDGLSGVSVDVSLIPPQAIQFAPDYRVHLLSSVPVLTFWQRPFRDINQLIKRGEDLILGAIALVLVSPVFGLAALLIRLTSPGPILFVQARTGFNNENINVLKFRTMYTERTDRNAEITTSRNDPRVTPLGRILRKLSIDELPQLINVIRGEMSLVGPRPHALEMKVGDRYYQDAVRGYAGRHRVKPGITGLAQVKGLRGEIRTVQRAKRRVELDKQYIDRWSLWLDLWILMATARAVLFDSDAY
jgi:Undecaprenyl-phosphate glucose phosphotransferase